MRMFLPTWSYSYSAPAPAPHRPTVVRAGGALEWSWGLRSVQYGVSTSAVCWTLSVFNAQIINDAAPSPAVSRSAPPLTVHELSQQGAETVRGGAGLVRCNLQTAGQKPEAPARCSRRKQCPCQCRRPPAGAACT
eukprot:scaffold18170_cov146-Isochrysis_galbana.AAC.2